MIDIVSTFVICVGLNACSLSTAQRCSVALGNNVQLPSGADHVLAVPGAIRTFTTLDDNILALIDKEMTRFNGFRSTLDREYVKDWNYACSIPPNLVMRYRPKQDRA